MLTFGHSLFQEPSTFLLTFARPVDLPPQRLPPRYFHAVNFFMLFTVLQQSSARRQRAVARAPPVPIEHVPPSCFTFWSSAHSPADDGRRSGDRQLDAGATSFVPSGPRGGSTWTPSGASAPATRAEPEATNPRLAGWGRDEPPAPRYDARGPAPTGDRRRGPPSHHGTRQMLECSILISYFTGAATAENWNDLLPADPRLERLVDLLKSGDSD